MVEKGELNDDLLALVPPNPAKRPRTNQAEAKRSTQKMPLDSKSIKVPMFALDCEMCETAVGNEVTRVSIVDAAGKVCLHSCMSERGWAIAAYACR